MIRRHHTAFRLTLMSADALSAMATVLVVSIFRFGADEWRAAWANARIDPVIAMAAFAGVWVAAIWLQGLYRLRARLSLRAEAVDVLRAGALVAVGVFTALFVLKMPEVSRLFLLMLFPAQVMVTFVSRLVLRGAFAWARSRGMSTRYVLMVGTGSAAQSFAERLERHRELGLRVIGHLELRSDDGPTGAPSESLEAPAVTRPILGHVDEIEDVLHRQVVDEVVICLPPAAWGIVEAVTRLCEEEGKIVRIPLLEGVISLPGARLEEFDGISILSLVHGPDRVIGLIGKRVLDISIALAALTFLSPVLIAIAIAIRVLDGPPVLFTQWRIGLHGRPFRVVKFRTMLPDAEERLAEVLALNEIQGHAFKITDDPRLSGTGRFLRRTSLDELPQLINVLRGEMSVVGPRPPLPREVDAYDVWHRRRLSMKPGITGLWQVAARREEAFDRWVELDLDYIDRWSLWLDLKIVVRTIPAMLRGR